MLDVFDAVAVRVERAARDGELGEALRRAVWNAYTAVRRVLQLFPELERLAREVEEAKREALSRLDYYIDRAMESLERAGAHAYLAESPADARRIIGDVVGSGKTVVLSKTITGEEIGLREYLEARGNRVYETDLGMFLVQLENGEPMHIIAPAIHMTRERAARLVEEKLGVSLGENPEPEEIVEAVRRYLRGRLVEADVGISGANALAADTGSIVLVENEGNIRLVTGLPRKHIAVVGVEKIVPTLLDAVKAAIVQAGYAGLYPPTYINIVSGPSSTGDIEHRRVYGAHGPRELHVVLVDNGRRRALRDPTLREALRCIRCGRCLYSCPVWSRAANNWGSSPYGGPMGVLWAAVIGSREEAEALAMLCTGCRACTTVCPMGIPLAELIHGLKIGAAERILAGRKTPSGPGG